MLRGINWPSWTSRRPPIPGLDAPTVWRYPPPVPFGWQLAHVVSEKLFTAECLDVIVALEWQEAQVYAGGPDGWHLAQTLAAPPWVIGKACAPL
jgi:hypothetical protein